VSRGFGPDELLACYARGVFPMADGRDDPRLFLVDPEERGIIPLDGFHVPKRLARTVRQDLYRITIDTAFREVVQACAAPHADRPETWINHSILELYDALHRRGQAHSVECWQGDNLVGGLYGVRLGSAFFGESMFSRARDASKVALVHLVAHLIEGGFKLLDSQFVTSHLMQFGILEIQRAAYHDLLAKAINSQSTFPSAALLGQDQLAGTELAPQESSDLHLDLQGSQLGPGARCLLAIAAKVPPRHSPHTQSTTYRKQDDQSV
jgi:leucyl/phenylalanyl-tRNA---protein transferase